MLVLVTAKVTVTMKMCNFRPSVSHTAYGAHNQLSDVTTLSAQSQLSDVISSMCRHGNRCKQISELHILAQNGQHGQGLTDTEISKYGHMEGISAQCVVMASGAKKSVSSI